MVRIPDGTLFIVSKIPFPIREALRHSDGLIFKVDRSPDTGIIIKFEIRIDGWIDVDIYISGVATLLTFIHNHSALVIPDSWKCVGGIPRRLLDFITVDIKYPVITLDKLLLLTFVLECDRVVPTGIQNKFFSRDYSISLDLGTYGGLAIDYIELKVPAQDTHEHTIPVFLDTDANYKLA